MKVEIDSILIGNIMKCSNYKKVSSFEIATDTDITSFGHIETNQEIYKENAILIKTKNGGYIDIDTLRTFLDYINIYRYTLKQGFRLGGLIMATDPISVNSLFVDEKSLKPYKNDNIDYNNMSIRQLKKSINRK